MSSKERQISNNSEKQKSKKPIIENSAIKAQEQILPAITIQRASLDPSTLTPCEVQQLQRAIGNRAVGQLLAGAGPRPVIQAKADAPGAAAAPVAATQPNRTGLPDALKAGVETLSGYSMDAVRVHYNSDKPAKVQALAYTQGTDIHVAQRQEREADSAAGQVRRTPDGVAQRAKVVLRMKADQAKIQRVLRDVLYGGQGESSPRMAALQEVIECYKVLQIQDASNLGFTKEACKVFKMSVKKFKEIETGHWFTADNKGSMVNHMEANVMARIKTGGIRKEKEKTKTEQPQGESQLEIMHNPPPKARLEPSAGRVQEPQQLGNEPESGGGMASPEAQVGGGRMKSSTQRGGSWAVNLNNAL